MRFIVVLLRILTISKKEKYYTITRLHKDDIINSFECEPEKTKNAVKKKVKTMTDTEMKYLADKLKDDYVDQLFWQSLRAIFTDKFLEAKNKL